MDTVTWVQILDKAIWISHGAKTFGKDMNSIILPTALIKIVGQTELFNLSIATGL